MSEGEDVPLCEVEIPTPLSADYICVCEKAAGHDGNHWCVCGHEWADGVPAGTDRTEEE